MSNWSSKYKQRYGTNEDARIVRNLRVNKIGLHVQ